MLRIDRDALKRAIVEARAQSSGRQQQVDKMLAKDDWSTVARFCAYSCQCENLRLKAWQPAPCWMGDERPTDDFPTRGNVAAWELRQRLIACGLSAFEPHPMRALAEREAAKVPPPSPAA